MLFAPNPSGFAVDRPEISDGLMTVPAGISTPSEVLREKLRSLKDARFDKARCEMLRYRVSESRFYPSVGTARLAEGHFKVTVWSKGQTEVYLVDEARLVRDP